MEFSIQANLRQTSGKPRAKPRANLRQTSGKTLRQPWANLLTLCINTWLRTMNEHEPACVILTLLNILRISLKDGIHGE